MLEILNSSIDPTGEIDVRTFGNSKLVYFGAGDTISYSLVTQSHRRFHTNFIGYPEQSRYQF